jgi:hypothetical protein
MIRKKIIFGFTLIFIVFSFGLIENIIGDDSSKELSYQVAVNTIKRTAFVIDSCGPNPDVIKYSSHKIYLDSAVYHVKATGSKQDISLECKVVRNTDNEWRVVFIRPYQTNIGRLKSKLGK